MKRTSCFSAAVVALALGAFVLTGCKEEPLVPDGPGDGTSPELVINVTGHMCPVKIWTSYYKV